MWHKCGKFCANIRDISEHLFFLVIAKVFGGTVAQGVFLDYKRWYKRIIAVPREIFTVAQLAHFVGIASLFKHWSDFALAHSATRRARAFLFS